MAELESTQKGTAKKFGLEQTEIAGKEGAGNKTTLGETVIGSRKRYEIKQTENIVPGSAAAPVVQTETPKNQ